MSTLSPLFYRFSGFHSLLIGLLPFYIPILLWQQGYNLVDLSVFIAVTGIGFLIAMGGWKYLYKQSYWKFLLIISFVTELVLISSIISEQHIIVMALLNGVYNCFYWVTQRTMFSALTQQQTQNSTGRHYGNFQIIIVVLLKIGILTGGYLLATQSLYWLLALSGVLSVAALLVLPNINMLSELPMTKGKSTLGWRRQLVFGFDGVFLFFESYFWVLTLYFITDNNVMNLGFLVVGLTIFLSVIFWVIKDKIDGLNQRNVFYVAIVLYALSWLLRGVIDKEQSEVIVMSNIMLIAFLTSFFRLSFNKLFFDDANDKKPLNFILEKSYLSQSGMVIFFSLLALVMTMIGEEQTQLGLLYWCVVPIALLYALYPLTCKQSAPVRV